MEQKNKALSVALAVQRRNKKLSQPQKEVIQPQIEHEDSEHIVKPMLRGAKDIVKGIMAKSAPEPVEAEEELDLFADDEDLFGDDLYEEPVEEEEVPLIHQVMQKIANR